MTYYEVMYTATFSTVVEADSEEEAIDKADSDAFYADAEWVFDDCTELVDEVGESVMKLYGKEE